MSILDLLRSDGHIVKKVASTHRGEYAGACPWCGGSDRFRIWPDDRSGRYWCRGCGKNGDAIQYLRDLHGLTYQEACERLDIEIRTSHHPLKKNTSKPVFTPKEITPPPPIWAVRASSFLDESQRSLWAGSGADIRAFLHGRGIVEDTIRSAGFGWNPSDIYPRREAWGLPGQTRENGKPKKLWLPEGLVIPLQDMGQLMRLRIRRTNPGDGPPYALISGSVVVPMRFLGDHDAVVVVESEIDGILLNQVGGDLVGVIALGSVTTRPDMPTHEALQNVGRILVALDNDKSGTREALGWWPKTYGSKTVRFPLPIGKDPSDALQKGLDLRAWLMVGLNER
jgi:hypothetical protein